MVDRSRTNLAAVIWALLRSSFKSLCRSPVISYQHIKARRRPNFLSRRQSAINLSKQSLSLELNDYFLQLCLPRKLNIFLPNEIINFLINFLVQERRNANISFGRQFLLPRLWSNLCRVWKLNRGRLAREFSLGTEIFIVNIDVRKFYWNLSNKLNYGSPATQPKLFSFCFSPHSVEHYFLCLNSQQNSQQQKLHSELIHYTFRLFSYIIHAACLSLLHNL